jgi:hypothetical protein
MEAFIFFMVLFLPFVFIIALTWLKNVYKQKRILLQADLYRKALETGQPVPPVPTGLFAEPQDSKKKSISLNVGIICMSIGIGIALTCWLIAVIAGNMPDNDDMRMSIAFKMFSSIGIIPFLIGIGFTIIHFIEKKTGIGENAQ